MCTPKQMLVLLRLGSAFPHYEVLLCTGVRKMKLSRTCGTEKVYYISQNYCSYNTGVNMRLSAWYSLRSCLHHALSTGCKEHVNYMPSIFLEKCPVL